LVADDPGAFWNLLDERASWFYEAVGAGAPKRPGLLRSLVAVARLDQA
jgi:hypothetical protein